MTQPPAPALPPTNLSASSALICFGYAALVLVLLHVLRPDYAPASHFLSDYAVGPYGWLMTSCFLALSAGLCALSIGMFRAGLRSRLARVALSLFGIAAFGLLICAIFPTDIPGAPATRAGDIHDDGFLLNVASILAGTVLLTVCVGLDLRWRRFLKSTLCLTGLILIAFVLQFVTLHQGMPYGLANRLFMAVLLTWLIAAALHLRGVNRLLVLIAWPHE